MQRDGASVNAIPTVNAVPPRAARAFRRGAAGAALPDARYSDYFTVARSPFSATPAMTAPAWHSYLAGSRVSFFL